MKTTQLVYNTPTWSVQVPGRGDIKYFSLDGEQYFAPVGSCVLLELAEGDLSVGWHPEKYMHT